MTSRPSVPRGAVFRCATWRHKRRQRHQGPDQDRQQGRDYLETLDWDKTAPGPCLPPEVIERTRAKYAEALEKGRHPRLSAEM